MDREWLFISERLNDVSRICGREHPIYEHVGNFGLALYVMGFFKCRDIMMVEDVDDVEAGTILKEHFVPVEKEKIPTNYNILKFKEKYLLVIGDPVFPTHFAVLINQHSPQPFFSKLKIYGAGYDSLSELESEFIGWEGIGPEDFHYYRMKSSVEPRTRSLTEEYIDQKIGERLIEDYTAPKRERKRVIEWVGK